MVSLSCLFSVRQWIVSLCAQQGRQIDKNSSMNVLKFWIDVYCFITQETKMEQPVFKQSGRNIMRWQACHYSIREDNAINSGEYKIISKPLIRTGELLYHADYGTEVQHRLYKHTHLTLKKMDIYNQVAFEQHTGVG